MITDALVNAGKLVNIYQRIQSYSYSLPTLDAHLGISSAVDNPEEYLNLTDDILRVIERSKAPELAKSRAIMKRLRTRDLYKFVDEFLIPVDLTAHVNKVIHLLVGLARPKLPNLSSIEHNHFTRNCIPSE